MSQHRIRRLGCVVLLAAALALVLGACGSSSSGNARSLLRQTFSGEHKVNSGRLSFALTVNPSGSSTLTSPISLGFSGPFQSLGKGKLPASDFTVSISAQGHTGALSILSTGTKGYVTMSGVSYQLPASSFHKLESSFSSISSSGSGSSSGKSSVLAKLGINPLNWLSHPRVLGSDTVGGAQTTHIRANVNVPNLLRDLSTFLEKASSVGISGTSGLSNGLSASSRQNVARAIRSPRFDLWTGTGDKTIRRLVLGLRLPVTGSIATQLGGMKSAGLSLSLQYADLNKPQTITAPTKVEPFSIFSGKLTALLQGIESGVASGALSGTGSSSTGSNSSGSNSTGTSTGGNVVSATSAYSQCIQKAGQDVGKMQQCASKLSGSGG